MRKMGDRQKNAPEGTITGQSGGAKGGFGAFHGAIGSDPLCGTVIYGRYEIIDRIGSGGMADIYLANDSRTRTKVALKVFTEGPERDKELSARFFREANAAALIDHPNVIRIVDLGTYKDKIFCVMEYIDGENLSDILARAGTMPSGRLLPIMSQACDALAAAHGRGIVHRDLKPANIMVTDRAGEDFVKVLDFGLAKVADSDDFKTKSDVLLGSPSYMAPEQAWGGGAYDLRVDIYSLGVVMYEMLTGSPPFRSDAPDERTRTLNILLAHRGTMPKPPRLARPDLDIPADVEAMVLRALEKDPGRRFQSAAEMRDAVLSCGIARDVPEAPEPIELAPAPEEVRERAAIGPATRKLERMLGGPMEDVRPRRSAGKLLRRVILAGALIAGIGYPLHRYGADIVRFVSGLQAGGIPHDAETSREPVPLPVRAPYQVLLNSEPTGATVYGLDGRDRVKLGVTPMTISLEKDEAVLLFSKKGYGSKRLAVKRMDVAQSFTIRLARERQKRQAGEGGTPQETEGRDASADSELPPQADEGWVDTPPPAHQP